MKKFMLQVKDLVVGDRIKPPGSTHYYAVKSIEHIDANRGDGGYYVIHLKVSYPTIGGKGKRELPRGANYHYIAKPRQQEAS